MVRLEEKKTSTEGKSIQRLTSGPKVYIPLLQHLGKICQPLVKAGDLVSLGQRIGSAEAQVFSPVHASVSGKVAAIQDWPHPSLGRCKAVVIENDGKETLSGSQGPRNDDEVAKFSADQIREIVLESGIVGMGGASFPTQIKLKPPKPVDTLIINGAECEPYLTADSRLMIEKTEEILKGIKLVQRCLGIKKVIIAIEENKPEAIEHFRNAIRNIQYTIQVLKSLYPQGGEKQLIKNVLDREVPSGKLPFDVGVVVHNVATIFAVYEGVYLNKPLYERVVTVTGSCLTNHKNLLVRIGTPIKELIDFCGPLNAKIAKVIIGGPMMGVAQYTLDAPVIKSTNGIVLFTEEEIAIQEEEFCIRCGRCVRECPSGLLPCLISLASERSNWKIAEYYNVADCIECGCCAYVCPAKRNMVQQMKQAKFMIARSK